jgi:hypothetical protein
MRTCSGCDLRHRREPAPGSARVPQTDNASWLIERHGFRPPVAIRAGQLSPAASPRGPHNGVSETAGGTGVPGARRCRRLGSILQQNGTARPGSAHEAAGAKENFRVYGRLRRRIVGWRVSRTAHANFVRDAWEAAGRCVTRAAVCGASRSATPNGSPGRASSPPSAALAAAVATLSPGPSTACSGPR